MHYHGQYVNCAKLDNDSQTEELKELIGEFVEYYTHQHQHNSLDNVTPAPVYHGRKMEVLNERVRIKKASFKKQRQLFLQNKL